jgi:hypothetical protein
MAIKLCPVCNGKCVCVACNGQMEIVTDTKGSITCPVCTNEKHASRHGVCQTCLGRGTINEDMKHPADF